MQLNYWAILVCGILSMVVGSIWYGPMLFGKVWMKIVGAQAMSPAEMKAMQKKVMPLYLVQFLITLFQVWVLANNIAYYPDKSALVLSLWVYAGFVVPIIAGTCMWNNDPKNIAWARFWVQAGYQLVLFIIFGLVLGMWK